MDHFRLTNIEKNEQMSAQNMIIKTVGPDGRWAYRMGGIASLAIGVAYVVIIALYASVGVQPVGGEARLDYLVGKTAT